MCRGEGRNVESRGEGEEKERTDNRRRNKMRQEEKGREWRGATIFQIRGRR